MDLVNECVYVRVCMRERDTECMGAPHAGELCCTEFGEA